MKDATDLNKENKIKQNNVEKDKKSKKSRSTSRDKKSEKTSKSTSKDKDLKKSSKSKEKKQKQETKEKDEEDDKEDITLENISQNQDLYSLLGLKKDATHEDIRKAYRSLVFKIHPDKNKDDPEASSKFANINKAYQILSNEETRRLYDETGEYDEEGEGRIDIEDTLNFFRKIYSTKDIENFEDKYIGSLEEEQDLKNYYIENNGNITNILECIPCSKNEDVERFINIYESLFRKKVLKKNKNYENSKNKIKLLKEDEKEKNEAKETLDKLTQQIMLNQKKRNFNDYLDSLANKYGKSDINEESDIHEEISEEEFQKISNRLNKDKKKRNKKNKK
mgnify:CR=1 FL=1